MIDAKRNGNGTGPPDGPLCRDVVISGRYQESDTASGQGWRCFLQQRCERSGIPEQVFIMPFPFALPDRHTVRVLMGALGKVGHGLWDLRNMKFGIYPNARLSVIII